MPEDRVGEAEHDGGRRHADGQRRHDERADAWAANDQPPRVLHVLGHWEQYLRKVKSTTSEVQSSEERGPRSAAEERRVHSEPDVVAFAAPAEHQEHLRESSGADRQANSRAGSKSEKAQVARRERD